MTVIGRDDQRAVAVDVDRWVRLAGAALAAEGVVDDAELALTFVDERAMAELNVAHMGHAGPTDVLSFPIDGAAPDAVGPVLLGDVVVCPAVAARQAGDHGRSVDDELALLVVHGVLHVLGHDHATPEEERSMQGRERDLLASLHRSPSA